MDQLGFPIETSFTMIALETLLLAGLHVRELLVNRFKLHFAEATRDLQIRKDVGMALSQVISKRKRRNPVENPRIERTSEGNGVEKHEMLLAFDVGGKPFHAMTTGRCVFIVDHFRLLLAVHEILAVSMNDADRWNHLLQRFWVLFMSNKVDLKVFVCVEQHFALFTFGVDCVRCDDVEDSVTVLVHRQMTFAIKSQMTIETRVLVGSAQQD